MGVTWHLVFLHVGAAPKKDMWLHSSVCELFPAGKSKSQLDSWEDLE
jgi:hypothetical protein